MIDSKGSDGFVTFFPNSKDGCALNQTAGEQPKAAKKRAIELPALKLKMSATKLNKVFGSNRRTKSQVPSPKNFEDSILPSSSKAMMQLKKNEIAFSSTHRVQKGILKLI